MEINYLQNFLCMKSPGNLILIASIVLLAGWSCRPARDQQTVSASGDSPAPVADITLVGALPQLVIYKTHKDYRFLVPVTLNDEKTAIESFPSPTDLFYEGELAIPAELKQEYLLDFRGITPNTAFLKLSYMEYANLARIPSAEELFKLILDKDPFIEIYLCGQRQGKEADIARANTIISTGVLQDCTKWK